MVRPIDEQIDVLLNGDPYAWALSNGYIQKGEPMMWSKIFTITQRDVRSYLQSHPVPGIDSNVGRYQSLKDGPNWRRDESGNFVIGWQERDTFTPDCVARSEDEFRAAWTSFLVGTLGLPIAERSAFDPKQTSAKPNEVGSSGEMAYDLSVERDEMLMLDECRAAVDKHPLLRLGPTDSAASNQKLAK